MKIGKVIENATDRMLGIISYDNQEIYFSGGLAKKDELVVFDIIDYVKSLKRAENVISYKEAINSFAYYYDQLIYEKNNDKYIKEAFELYYKALVKFEENGLSIDHLDLNCVQLKNYKKFTDYNLKTE